jgi:3-oxoacyl-[acyl-carrier-protein] synthase-3
LYASQILGTGSFLPEKLLTNRDLEKIVETSHDWIVERTGISSRHIVADDEVTTDLALRAAERALEAAGLKAQQIDAIIFATVTPDQIMPSAACILQAKLGCKPIMAFDLSAACSGFLYGLTIADQFVGSGLYRNVLVVGAETLSRIMDYKDRTTCILFGDGAGAFIVGRAREGSGSAILATAMEADGTYGDLLSLPGGGSKHPTTAATVEQGLQFVRMKGREIFKAAVRAMSQRCEEVLDRARVPKSAIDWIVPHQANTRIIDAVGDQLGLPQSKVVSNLAHTGNTSSASIPIAFDEAVRDGRIQRGQTLLLGAFGGGLTSGAVVLKF